MNTQYERMSGFSLKLMATIAGVLMTPVFAAPPQHHFTVRLLRVQ